MNSRGEVCVVAFLDVNVQKLLLPERSAAEVAGERLLAGVGSGVSRHVTLLGGAGKETDGSAIYKGFYLFFLFFGWDIIDHVLFPPSLRMSTLSRKI